MTSTSPVTVRGIPLSLVEEESAEISRRIDQALNEKRSLSSDEISVSPINTVQSDLSQISGTIIVQASNSGIFYTGLSFFNYIYIYNQIHHNEFHI